jgi:hypothetical protein
LRKILKPIFPNLYATLAVPSQKNWLQRRLVMEAKIRPKPFS